MGITATFHFDFSATFGNPNAGGGINNGAAAIKLEAASHSSSGNGNNYYTCATYGSPSPGAQEHHQQQQSLLATSAYSKLNFTVFLINSTIKIKLSSQSSESLWSYDQNGNKIFIIIIRNSTTFSIIFNWMGNKLYTL